MRSVIDTATHLKLGEGPFNIDRIRPGYGLQPDDTGFGVLGLVDRAHLKPGLVVEMHEHVDDEIVSYLRTGTLRHEDSDGNVEEVTRDRLMVMNAGHGFSHEETMPEGEEGGEDIHMLQIFIRPRAAGLEPAIQFAPLDEAAMDGAWRPLVRPDHEDGPAPTSVRQDVHLFDARLEAGDTLAVPSREGSDQWLYVFGGAVRLADGVELHEGAVVATKGAGRIETIEATKASTVLLFEMSSDAAYTMEGSLSRGR